VTLSRVHTTKWGLLTQLRSANKPNPFVSKLNQTKSNYGGW